MIRKIAREEKLERSEKNSFRFGDTAKESMELRKLILKLRWIGLEEEAQELSSRLAELSPQTTLIGEFETD